MYLHFQSVVSKEAVNFWI